MRSLSHCQLCELLSVSLSLLHKTQTSTTWRKSFWSFLNYNAASIWQHSSQWTSSPVSRTVQKPEYKVEYSDYINSCVKKKLINKLLLIKTTSKCHSKLMLQRTWQWIAETCQTQCNRFYRISRGGTCFRLPQVILFQCITIFLVPLLKSFQIPHNFHETLSMITNSLFWRTRIS